MSIDIIDPTVGDPRWEAAFPVLRELRPHLTEEILSQVLTEGEPQGLRFTALFDGSRCVASAGWRVMASVNTIRTLYIDDLSTTATA